MTLYVADIASYQSGLVPAQLKPDCAALIVKCTQGTSYVDPYYAAWLDEARAAGLLVGAYHYVDGTSPAQQAANLKAHIIDPTLAVMLDEEAVGLPQTLKVADAMAAVGLHVKLVYLARSYWSAIGSPDLSKPFGSRGIALVNASYPSAAVARAAQLYPGDGNAAWNQYGGVTPTLWQFTDAASEAGQRIDVSAFRGSMTQLTELFTTTASPAPKPAPGQLEEDEMPYFPIQVGPDKDGKTNGCGSASWPAGIPHVIQLVGDPSLYDAKSWSFRLALHHADRGPSVAHVTITAPINTGVLELSETTAHLPTLRGVTVTRDDGATGPWAGHAS